MVAELLAVAKGSLTVAKRLLAAVKARLAAGARGTAVDVSPPRGTRPPRSTRTSRAAARDPDGRLPFT